MTKKIVFTVTFLYAISASVSGLAESIIVTEINNNNTGENYSVLRKLLVSKGERPEFNKNKLSSCSAAQSECKLFPELSGCTFDEPRRCYFRWISENQKKYDIVTLGENAAQLKVEFAASDASALY